MILMKMCEMGKTYIKLNGETGSYDEIQNFFEEWGLEKVSEEPLGSEPFHRVITYMGKGIEFKLIWYINISTIRICGDKNWYGDFVEASFDTIKGSYLPDCDHNTFDFTLDGHRTLKLSILRKGDNKL